MKGSKYKSIILIWDLFLLMCFFFRIKTSEGIPTQMSVWQYCELGVYFHMVAFLSFYSLSEAKAPHLS